VSARQRRGCTGLGSYNWSWVRVRVPTKWLVAGSNGIEYSGEFNPVEFSHVLQHELDHNRGLRHSEMVACRTIDCNWAKAFEVKRKQDKPKPVRDLKKERHEHALKKVKEFETKKRRTETLLKKWKRKVRYYEKA